MQCERDSDIGALGTENCGNTYKGAVALVGVAMANIEEE